MPLPLPEHRYPILPRWHLVFLLEPSSLSPPQKPVLGSLGINGINLRWLTISGRTVTRMEVAGQPSTEVGNPPQDWFGEEGAWTPRLGMDAWVCLGQLPHCCHNNVHQMEMKLTPGSRGVRPSELRSPTLTVATREPGSEYLTFSASRVGGGGGLIMWVISPI